MSTIVVLQARTSSTRLPAKVLLPIGGLPVAVLAAKRAANTGMNIVVVTSVDKSDDALAETLNYHGISCFRGSLNDTLARFVNALTEHDDDDIVIRLTGDNVFPDGVLLGEIEQNFREESQNYLCCNGEQSGLPYGVSVELTYLKHLRNAHDSTTSVFDREHVTPYIIRLFGKQYFKKYKDLEKGLYRATIDNLDDYLRMKEVFSAIDDPVSVPMIELLNHLCLLKDSPIVKHPVSQLVIGGAQLGLIYGVANNSGRPSDDDCEKLIKTAINNGVNYIDTAHAYGDSEAVIGRVLAQGWMARVNVITKLSPLDECPEDTGKKSVHAFVEASVYQSCSLLRCQKLDVLMLHRASHISGWGGHVWQKLIELKDDGIIQKLGVSVQSPDELEYVLEEPLIEFIQMPFNILDDRWKVALDKLRNTKSDRGVMVHVRSVFLQGLLLSNNPAHWEKANVENYRPIIDWLNALVEKYSRRNIADLCLAYVRSQDWVDGVVVGMETTVQLDENIKFFDSRWLEESATKYIEMQRAVMSDAVLNPANWKKG